jgi:hypothetical protein
MAIVKIEGFDLVGSNTDLLSKGFASAQGTWGAAKGTFGGGGYDLANSANDVLAFSQTFIRHNTITFWWRNNAAAIPTDTIIAGVSDVLIPITAPSIIQSHMFIRAQTNGTIELLGDFIVRAISGPVLSPQTWHHIEIQADINAAGTTNVYVDGILAVTATGDFIDGTLASSIVFYGNSGVNVFDDVVLQSDASTQQPLIGEHKIHTLMPDADTAQTDWVRSSGTNDFEMIDDTIPGSSNGDTDYISTATLNAKSEFSVANLAESPTTIHAVQTVVEARKTDAGAKAVTPYVQSGATRGDGAEFSTGETYAYRDDIFLLDPNTASAWTETTVNAVLVGVEITT